MSSPGFYDKFISQQALSGINDRIYGLFLKMRERGFTSSSRVLEIGCGIGTLTWLLKETIRGGRVEATDLSPASIAFAQQHIHHPSIRFYAGNILEIEPLQPGFDYITVFDVLEHIPLDQHPVLFSRLAKWMTDETVLLVNIPHPDYIRFDQQYRPETLQELDQPVDTALLMSRLSEAGLELISFETWSVWVENDYQFLCLRKKRPFTEKILAEKRNFWQKARTRISREWRKIRFPYPPKGSY